LSVKTRKIEYSELEREKRGQTNEKLTVNIEYG